MGKGTLLFAGTVLGIVGLIAKSQFTPSAWCSTNRDKECSIYTLGLIMVEKTDASPPAAFPPCWSCQNRSHQTGDDSG